MKKLTVHIADDYNLIIDGFKSNFKNEIIDVVGTSKNGRETIKWFENNTADVLILDISMPKLNGIEVLKYFKEKNIIQKTIIFSSYLTFDFIQQSMLNSAKGYIYKSDDVDIVEAVKTLVKGGVHYSKAVKNFLVEEYKKSSSKPVLVLLTEALSENQLSIVKMLVNEYTPKEIAEKKQISPITIRSQLKRIRDKINVTTNVGLVMKYSFLYKK